MKKIVLFFALAFTAMSGRASVPTGTATDTIVPSVLYAESVFDTLYPVFRGVANVYRFMPKIGWAILEGRTWSQKALRVLGAGGGAPMFP